MFFLVVGTRLSGRTSVIRYITRGTQVVEHIKTEAYLRRETKRLLEEAGEKHTHRTRKHFVFDATEDKSLYKLLNSSAFESLANACRRCDAFLTVAVSDPMELSPITRKLYDIIVLLRCLEGTMDNMYKWYVNPSFGRKAFDSKYAEYVTERRLGELWIGRTPHVGLFPNMNCCVHKMRGSA